MSPSDCIESIVLRTELLFWTLMHLFLAEFGQVGAIHLLGQIDFAIVGGRGGGAL